MRSCRLASLVRLSVVIGFIALLFLLYFCVILLSEEFQTRFEEDYDIPQVTPRSHVLCVIVPYRDRLEELTQFAPYMGSFLKSQNVEHIILVVNQTDSLRFNRASLINVGWNEADRLGCDYMVMNDVDLLPVNPEIPYGFPGIGTIRHITSPEYHPKYNYSKFIGGILMLTMADYKLLNGMSNKYWGWGLEDDEFYLRISESDLRLTRVSGLTTNRSNTFRHLHGPERKRDYSNSNDKVQRAFKRQRDRISGLKDVSYKIATRRAMNIQNITFQVIDVELNCDISWTPYCKL
ncbi:unnamed protein product [Caenorhabditis auriculariae]|uniref:Uncharacterized protein n=1 Tax=Caenorhabditis auriculariae TaxID=2777116 RepID=A0A8S1GWB7_9PELO|nr:unnamed protein product [Caenorhabditis auriculariae]